AERELRVRFDRRSRSYESDRVGAGLWNGVGKDRRVAQGRAAAVAAASPCRVERLAAIGERHLHRRVGRGRIGRDQLASLGVEVEPRGVVGGQRPMHGVVELEMRSPGVVGGSGRGMGTCCRRGEYYRGKSSHFHGGSKHTDERQSPPETASHTFHALKATRSQVVRFLLEAQGLTTHRRTDTLAEIRRLECVQIDPVAAVERNQHLVLSARIPSYRPESLDALLAAGKTFEYFANAAMVMPIEDYPVFAGSRRRYTERVVKYLEPLGAVPDEIRSILR